MAEIKSQGPKNQKTKNKSSWFKTENKFVKNGPLVVSLVTISTSTQLSKKDALTRQKRRSLVISVPRACGSAVKRNRFRRIVRANIKELIAPQLLENKGLWIRLLNYHKLPRAILWKDWKKPIEQSLVRLGFALSES